MEAWRKATLCSALLVLLVVAGGEPSPPRSIGALEGDDELGFFMHVRSLSLAGAAVSTAQGDHCWKDDDHHPICVSDDCRMTCKDHGHEDGRCNWTWGRLLPHCQCQLANCN